MKRLILFAVVLALVIPAAASQYKYTAVQCPGMKVAFLLGINNSGDMVGAYYTDRDPTTHALIIRGRRCIPVAPRTIVGKKASFAEGINERGDIVGAYFDGELFTSKSHGFMLDKRGRLTDLSFPTADGTWPYKINDSGTVVGKWNINDANGDLLSWRGFIWKNGQFSEYMYPGSADTLVLGINSRGEYVGEWDIDWYGPVWHGYLCSRGKCSSIDAQLPDAAATITTDINEKGDIAGQFTDVNSTTFGFLKLGPTYTSFNYPGAVATGFEGINDKGQMVGWYYDADWVCHGLLVERTK